MRSVILVFGAAAAVLLTLAMLLNAGWTHPPVHTAQMGFRGLSLGQLSTPESERLQKLANALPDPIDKASPDGDRAVNTYKNVKVLTDLSVEQFNRVMLGMSAWVAPSDVGCAYCHNVENMADDSLYTKNVARVMLKMTRHINQDWKAHVGATGVVCYTCHRGMPVPANIWFEEPRDTAGFATNNWTLGHPNKVADRASLSGDPFSGYLDAPVGSEVIRVQASKALPEQGIGTPILKTEKTYSLMVNMSTSLGVNCTYCHNTRAFANWPQSTQQRVTAWHGIQMTRELNAQYLKPADELLPPNRLGPAGDGPKVFCATCHNNAPKPLLGVSIAKDWPELGGAAAQ